MTLMPQSTAALKKCSGFPFPGNNKRIVWMYNDNLISLLDHTKTISYTEATFLVA